MNRGRGTRALVILATLAFIVAACSSDKKNDASGGSGSSSTSSSSGSSGSSGAYKVDTSNCPSDVNDKITGTVKVGSTMPLSGGAAAAAFAPVAQGLKAYINEANEKNLVPGVKIDLTIKDDQFNPTLTTPAVEKLRDQTGLDLSAWSIWEI